MPLFDGLWSQHIPCPFHGLSMACYTGRAKNALHGGTRADELWAQGSNWTVDHRYMPLYSVMLHQFHSISTLQHDAKICKIRASASAVSDQSFTGWKHTKFPTWTPCRCHWSLDSRNIFHINILFDEGWALSQTLLKFLKNQIESFGARWLAYDAFACLCWNDVLWGRPALNPISIEEVQSVPDSDGGAWFIPLLKVVRWSLLCCCWTTSNHLKSKWHRTIRTQSSHESKQVTSLLQQLQIGIVRLAIRMFSYVRFFSKFLTLPIPTRFGDYPRVDDWKTACEITPYYGLK